MLPTYVTFLVQLVDSSYPKHYYSMKKIIYRTNQHLLERYPLIWNTKAIWMLSISIILHIFFYVFGFISLTNPESLHNRRADSIFFENGAVFFSVMISILMLVIWLIYLFKNNAFKSFYPTNHFALFKQFALYFAIIFCSTTFYYSFQSGLKTYIVNKYDDETMKGEIELANKAAPFFSENIEDYTIDKLVYPKPFGDLFCETNHDFIDYAGVYYQFLNNNYQFYSLSQKTREANASYVDSLYRNSVYTMTKDSHITYYFKDKVIDVTENLKSTEPSYYNYSDVFYLNENNGDSNNSLVFYDQYDYDYKNRKNSRFSKLIQKENQELLARNNPNEIKEILTGFIDIANKYKIKHNLTTNGWFDLVYAPKDFKLKALIQDEYRTINNTKYNQVNLTKTQELYNELVTEYYLESLSLNIAFENIDDIKNTNVISENIHLFLWLCFFLAIVIFIFRVTGLKPLLFTVVIIGLLTIIIGLFIALYSYISSYRGKDIEYFSTYLILFIGTIILSITLFLNNRLRKTIAAIFLNISLLGFIPYLFLIVGIISMHQKDACRDSRYLHPIEKTEDCFVLMEYLGLNWSYVFFIIAFIFVLFFSKIILKWKAMAEA